MHLFESSVCVWVSICNFFFSKMSFRDYKMAVNRKDVWGLLSPASIFKQGQLRWVAQGFISGWVLSIPKDEDASACVWLPKTRYSTQEAASQLMIRGDGSPHWPAGNTPPNLAHYAVSFLHHWTHCCFTSTLLFTRISRCFLNVTFQVVVPSKSWYQNYSFPGAALGISPLSDSLKFWLAVMDNIFKGTTENPPVCFSDSYIHFQSSDTTCLDDWLFTSSHRVGRFP